MEDPEDRRHQVRRARQQHPDPRLRADPLPRQPGRDPRRPFGQLAIGHLPLLPDQRRGVRRPLCLRREAPVDWGCVCRLGDLRDLRISEQLPALGGREQRQLRRPLAGMRRQLGEQGDEAAGPARNGRGVEEVGVVAQGAGDPAAQLDQGEPEVELGPGQVERQGIEMEGAEVERGGDRDRPPQDEGGDRFRRQAVRPLQGEQGLEDGRAAGVAPRLQPLDQQREREVLVRQGPHHLVSGARQELAAGRLAGRAAAQHQRVDEITDHPGELGPAAAGGGGAEQPLILAGEPREEELEGSGEDGEEGRPRLCRQRFESRGRPGVDGERQGGAAEARHRRPRMVNRQLQHRQLPPAQPLAPEPPQPLPFRAGEPLALRGGVCREGAGRRQVRLVRQEPPQLVDQHHQRPEVDRDVMSGD